MVTGSELNKWISDLELADISATKIENISKSKLMSRSKRQEQKYLRRTCRKNIIADTQEVSHR
jgi:hypothetical protein